MIHQIYRYFLTQKKEDNDNYFLKSLRWRLYKYLKRRLMNYYLKLPLNQLKTDVNSDLIVSLTSFPQRINNVHLVIKSILNQSYKPHKVILWLGIEYFPNKDDDLPSVLIDLKKRGLEIEFCEDLKPHTKYFYAFKKYPKNRIVTVDDDLFYPKNMLEKLLQFHEIYPNAIVANRVREISFTNGRINNYRNWKINSVKESEPSKIIFATGVGGVLYQPHLFSEELFNKTDIKKMSLNADDVWLKANQMLNDIKVVWTNYYFQSFIELPESQLSNLHSLNVFSGKNDERIVKVFKFFKIEEESFYI